MAKANKATVQDPAAQGSAKNDAEEQELDSEGSAESGTSAESDGTAQASEPPTPPAPRASLIALLEVRSKQALATGQFREHAALDQLVGAAHHLKSKASHALETLTDEDADLVRQLYRAL